MSSSDPFISALYTHDVYLEEDETVLWGGCATGSGGGCGKRTGAGAGDRACGGGWFPGGKGTAEGRCMTGQGYTGRADRGGQDYTEWEMYDERDLYVMVVHP